MADAITRCEAGPRRSWLRLRTLAWAGLALAALASFFPLGFTATSTLMFDLGTQPPTATVRGIAELLRARDLAQEAVERLPASDATRLAATTLPFARDDRPLPARAAAAVFAAMQVTPVQGGRGLVISVSAPRPEIARRTADAYVAAFLAMQSNLRSDLPGAGSLPTLRRGADAVSPVLPDPPGPLSAGLLAAGALLILIASRRWQAEPLATGPVDPALLPSEVASEPRVAWLDGGSQGGLDVDGAIRRLLPRLAAPDGTGRLVLLASDDGDEATAGFAGALARRLAEERRVVLVASGPAGIAGETAAAGPGLSDLLAGQAGFAEVIRRAPSSWAHVIPAGNPGADEARADPAALAGVLDALRRTYDVVIADTRLASGSDAAAFAELDPLLVYVQSDTAPSSAAVELVDGPGALSFARLVILRHAGGGAMPQQEPPAPVPSLDAEPAAMPARRARAPELPMLAGAA